MGSGTIRKAICSLVVRKKHKSRKKVSHQLPERELDRTLDHTHLCGSYHRATVASLALVKGSFVADGVLGV